MRGVIIVQLALTLGLASPAYGDRSRGDCSGREDGGSCQDNDFSPSFDNGPVFICVQPESCRFEENKDARRAPRTETPLAHRTMSTSSQLYARPLADA